MQDFPHIYRWDRQDRKGQMCRVLARGNMNSCLVEFPDGYCMVTSRNAIGKAAIHTTWPARSQPTSDQSDG
jgi:hypothetical protein